MGYLPLGSFGTKSTVLVFALKFSPVPSIQTYIHWTFNYNIDIVRSANALAYNFDPHLFLLNMILTQMSYKYI